MNQEDALKQLSHMARERAFGGHIGSDRLIQPGLDALIAGVGSPSLAMPAGLLRSDLGYPEDLQPLVHCALNLASWEESWGISVARDVLMDDEDAVIGAVDANRLRGRAPTGAGTALHDSSCAWRTAGT
ncbi:hypothetical protein [Streptomyces sp. NPDC007856]|uniref:hypothetical protein n=1 Tax=Streptomyces sp. NPDC007856 TaxID=3364781 RepID=UPI003689D487